LGCLHSAIGAAKLKIAQDLGKKNPSLFEGLAPDRIKAAERVFESLDFAAPGRAKNGGSDNRMSLMPAADIFHIRCLHNILRGT